MPVAAQPDALVAGKQIFATHYMNGALALTAIVGGGPGSRRYLAYLNRSEVDVLGGFLGGLVRWIVERRLKSEASEVLQGLRRRIERGLPPVARHGSADSHRTDVAAMNLPLAKST